MLTVFDSSESPLNTDVDLNRRLEHNGGRVSEMYLLGSTWKGWIPFDSEWKNSKKKVFWELKTTNADEISFFASSGYYIRRRITPDSK